MFANEPWKATKMTMATEFEGLKGRGAKRRLSHAKRGDRSALASSDQMVAQDTIGGRFASVAAHTQPKAHRRNLTLPDSSLQAIAKLRHTTDAISDAEVIRNALKVYETIVTSQHQGSELFLRKDGIDKALLVV